MADVAVLRGAHETLVHLLAVVQVHAFCGCLRIELHAVANRDANAVYRDIHGNLIRLAHACGCCAHGLHISRTLLRVL